MKKIKYFSACTGIGSIEIAIGPGHECVGFSEIDGPAIEIYKNHYPNHKNYGNIKEIDEKKLPDFDLFFAGFPCQSFSIAGPRTGFEDTRGTIFFEIARILRAKKPRLILLENVKGLLSHEGGRTYATIKATLDELGYITQRQTLNSKDYGVPQNRERIFLVGHLRGTRGPEVFPLTGNHSKDFTGTLQASYYKGGHTGPYVFEKIGTLRTYKDGAGFREMRSGLCPTLPARARNDGTGSPVILQRSRGFNKGNLHKISPTMGSNAWQHNNFVLKGYTLRRLTPKECERLQGFPDNWTKGVSDTQRYKTLGNAITVNAARAVIKRMIK